MCGHQKTKRFFSIVVIFMTLFCLIGQTSQAQSVDTYDDPIQGCINAKSLNLRSEPNRSSTIIKECNNNQAVQILGEDEDWYLVEVSGDTGYMLKKYVATNTESSSDDKTTSETKQGYINANSLNLRAKPDKASKLLGAYDRGATVLIIEEKGDWYKVAIAGLTGYMLKQYVKEGIAPTTTKTTTTRSSTSTSSSQTKSASSESATSSGQYVGSSEKNIFHVPSCKWAKKILPSNEIWWSSREEAMASGRKACKVCKP